MRHSLTVKRFLAIMKRTHVLPGAVCALLMMIPAKGLDCDIPFEMIGTQCLFVDLLEKGSFYDMRFYCTNVLGQAARLVRIENATQLAVLSDYIYFSGLDHSNFWIDATDEGHEGRWKWGDGSPVPMGTPFWGYDCENNFKQMPSINFTRNCGVLQKSSYYRFGDVSCLNGDGEINSSPICEKI